MPNKSNLLNNDGASISTMLRHGIRFSGLPMSKFYTYPSNPVKPPTAARYAVSTWTLIVVAYQKNKPLDEYRIAALGPEQKSALRQPKGSWPLLRRGKAQNNRRLYWLRMINKVVPLEIGVSLRSLVEIT